MINGKLRSKLLVNNASTISEAELESRILLDEKVKNLIGGQSIKRVVYVQNKCINVVV